MACTIAPRQRYLHCAGVEPKCSPRRQICLVLIGNLFRCSRRVVIVLDLDAHFRIVQGSTSERYGAHLGVGAVYLLRSKGTGVGANLDGVIGASIHHARQVSVSKLDLW